MGQPVRLVPGHRLGLALPLVLRVLVGRLVRGLLVLRVVPLGLGRRALLVRRGRVARIELGCRALRWGRLGRVHLVVREVLVVLGCRVARRFRGVLGFQLRLGRLGFLGVLMVREVPVGKACMVVALLVRKVLSGAFLGFRALLGLLVCRVVRSFRALPEVRADRAGSSRRTMERG